MFGLITSSILPELAGIKDSIASQAMSLSNPSFLEFLYTKIRESTIEIRYTSGT
jgi:hypothetical protein